MLMSRGIFIPNDVLLRLRAEGKKVEMRIAIGRAIEAGVLRRASDEDVTDMWKAVAPKANGHASP